LNVTVWDHPELTIPAGEFRSPEATGNPVGADGTMFYPHVGVVEVGGKTLREIRELLTQRLAKVIQRPQLDVRVAAFRGKKIQVTGEVTAPSTLPITDVPMRALDAIAQARGTTAEADLRNVTLTRGGKTFALNLQAVNEEGDLTQNWLLQDGDVLHVPDRRLNRVFVLGEVKRPSTQLMHKGRLSLADALGNSEGVDLATANTGAIYVIRGSFDAPRIFKLDASSPDSLLLATQFELEPRDVVFVSTTGVVRWNRTISQIAPTVQMLWQGFDITRRSIQ
jgi:polysaccharide biosynthesis/export protein